MRTSSVAAACAVIAVLIVLTPARADDGLYDGRYDGLYWVVGGPSSGCWIVRSNPLIDGIKITFSDGPYRSEADAKLAMSTIGICRT